MYGREWKHPEAAITANREEVVTLMPSGVLVRLCIVTLAVTCNPQTWLPATGGTAQLSIPNLQRRPGAAAASNGRV